MGVTRSRFSARSAPDEVARPSSTPAGRGSRAGVVVLLEDAADVEDGDAVAHLHRLLDVVGDEHDRLLHLALQPQELVLQPHACHRVDGAERLVHEEDGRDRRRARARRRRAGAARPTAARDTATR